MSHGHACEQMKLLEEEIAQLLAKAEAADSTPLQEGPGSTDQYLNTREGKALYGQRKQTVEPVFGIIKEAMKFRRFMLPGLYKTKLEWSLVTISYNVRRLFHMQAALKLA